jgi:hypothetical protein
MCWIDAEPVSLIKDISNSRISTLLYFAFKQFIQIALVYILKQNVIALKILPCEVPMLVYFLIGCAGYNVSV